MCVPIFCARLLIYHQPPFNSTSFKMHFIDTCNDMSFNFTNPDIALLDISSNCVSTSITLTILPIKRSLCQVSLWIFSNCRNPTKWKTMFYLCKYQFSESRNSIPNEDCPMLFFSFSVVQNIFFSVSLPFCHIRLSAISDFPPFVLFSVSLLRRHSSICVASQNVPEKEAPLLLFMKLQFPSTGTRLTLACEHMC